MTVSFLDHSVPGFWEPQPPPAPVEDRRIDFQDFPLQYPQTDLQLKDFEGGDVFTGPYAWPWLLFWASVQNTHIRQVSNYLSGSILARDILWLMTGLPTETIGSYLGNNDGEKTALMSALSRIDHTVSTSREYKVDEKVSNSKHMISARFCCQRYHRKSSSHASDSSK